MDFAIFFFYNIRKSTVSQSFAADTDNNKIGLDVLDVEEVGGGQDGGLDQVDVEEVEDEEDKVVDEGERKEIEEKNGQEENEEMVTEENVERSRKEKELGEKSRMEEEKKREKMVEAELKKSRASYSIKLAQQLAKEMEEQRRADALPPRAGGVIKVAFNKREFKHPARESKKEEEEEWLRRQAKAKAAKKKLEEDEGSMEYEEVVRKAGSFYQVGDLGSALEVLNQGLRLFPESAALWSKRTTVQISLEEWEPALEDSEIALRLLQPEVSLVLNKDSLPSHHPHYHNYLVRRWRGTERQGQLSELEGHLLSSRCSLPQLSHNIHKTSPSPHPKAIPISKTSLSKQIPISKTSPTRNPPYPESILIQKTSLSKKPLPIQH